MTPEYIGVDLHKAFFQACAVTVSGERLWEGRFPRTAEGLERFTARLGVPAHVAVEACGPTWPFVDALVPSGAAICVVDPRKTKLKAGFAAKTDRLDARRLADALRRDSVVSVYIPPPAIRGLGMRGGFLRPNPYNGRMLHHPDYEPFWSEVEELDFSIGLHEGASGGMPQVGVDRFETRGARHIISHTMEMMLAAMSVIWGGVCDRHPRVRIAFLESGGGWIAPWLDRMDRHFDDQGFNDSNLSMRPSELFRRNGWISF